MTLAFQVVRNSQNSSSTYFQVLVQARTHWKMSGGVKSFVDGKIGCGKKVIMFSKTTCSYCERAKKIFKEYSLSDDQYEVIEIDHRGDMSAMQDYLAQLTKGRSVPRVFVNGNFLGGCDDTQAAHNSGELKKLLSA